MENILFKLMCFGVESDIAPDYAGFIRATLLAEYRKDELYLILRLAFNALAYCTPNSLESKNALASIEVVKREIRSRAFRF